MSATPFGRCGLHYQGSQGSPPDVGGSGRHARTKSASFVRNRPGGEASGGLPLRVWQDSE